VTVYWQLEDLADIVAYLESLREPLSK